MGRIVCAAIFFGAGIVSASTYAVNSLADAGAGTLRQAITDANGHPGQDTIIFALPGTISLSSPLPAVTDTTVIDAQSTFVDSPGDTLDGGGSITVGLELNGTGSNKGNRCVVMGLCLRHFTQKAVYLNQSNSNNIGGAVLNQINVINSNGSVGIFLQGSSGNVILGNMIGTDVDGINTQPNGTGIRLAASPLNTIGGLQTGRNTIAGNTDDGISITDFTSTDNVIKGNSIGTNLSGTTDLGNGRYGILLENGARYTKIGGSGNKEGNQISFNRKGVVVKDDNTDYNTISRNSFHSNDSLGIDLGNDGVGVQPGSGSPNAALAAPVIVQAAPDTVRGTAPALSTVEIFKAAPDPSGYGEGRFFSGAGTASPSGSFAVGVSGLIPGDTVTATATDGPGNSSEFSNCKRVDRWQPDNWIATTLSPADDYAGNDTINTDGTHQTKNKQVVPYDSVLYFIKIQNDGSAADSLRVTGTAGAGNWTVSFYDSTAAGSDITAGVTGSGWFTKPLASGAAKEIRLVVKAGAVTAADSTKDVLVTSASTVDTAKKDAVKAATAAKLARPDNQIATQLDGSDFAGDGIYNTDGSQQTHSLSATATVAARYFIKIENDGNVKDRFFVKGDTLGGFWRAFYYSDTTGGTDITAAVAAGSFATDSLDPAGSKKIRLEVKPTTGVPASDTLEEILVLSTSSTDTSKKDAVKAVTRSTAVTEPAPTPFRFALLKPAPNPARRIAPGAAVEFTVAVRCPVDIEIFDIAGRTVRTLSERNPLDPGRYRRTWDGRDDLGTILPAGVYFVGMSAGSYRKTEKLVIVP